MKRIVLLIIALVFLAPAAIIGFQILHEPETGRPPVAANVIDVREQAARGEYLAKAGNCMACHTTRGGNAYAGGRAIATPFGSIYSSNITPDPETGIGRWTSDDFWRAIHHGKSKDGRFLYPAFPYPNYTRVTREDADAMHAYFKTIAPVRQANREHDLRFPYNQRILLAFWRTLYFTPGVHEAQPGRSAEWNRGKYLVQGLGHCSACHTSRNALGGSSSDDLAGGMIPMLNWHASSLSAGPGSALEEWNRDDIADLLKTGVSRRGAVFGPMAEVVGGSLQHLSDPDIQAMASYLASAPQTAVAPVAPVAAARQVPGDIEAVLKQGGALYDKHCVECHKADGKGAPPAYPPLAGNRSLAAQPAVNPIRIVINGGYSPATGGNPRPYGMPPFGTALNDTEVAAVVSYIRMTWGNDGGPVSAIEVGRFRGAPLE
ncbi:c-type cytochrome [Noviherbaspirillum aerium]|uniref:c-type cytochrome n=1 Tax=Noviherbaspirillum aerium TaxID=2588497 RepID=UPI00124C7960|nr:cytochrome c [Noviherbaspirillum aerium]